MCVYTHTHIYMHVYKYTINNYSEWREPTQSLQMQENINLHILSFMRETDLLPTHHRNIQWQEPGAIH